MNKLPLFSLLLTGSLLSGSTTSAETVRSADKSLSSETNRQQTKAEPEIISNVAEAKQDHAARPQRRPGLAAPAVDARKIERDVIYGKADGVELKLDFYFPKKTEGKLPVTVYVHGGGWQNGDKGSGAGTMAIGELVKRGYLVASVNYRLAPTYKFPAQIEDVKCAIRFLRAQANEYNLDPKRIGVWGGSAGGHLVALLGTSDAKAGLEGKGGWADQSSRVQAVVDLFGPTDLTVEFPGGNARIAETVFGAASSKDEVMKRASPVTYITPDDPPYLILHGDSDRLVPLSQSEELHQRLRAAGVPSKLVVVKNAGHSFKPSGGTPQPDRQELTKMIADFFDQTLRK